MNRSWKILAVAACVSTLPWAYSAVAGEEYRHPVAAIPYAAVKPVIDGTVGDAEWQCAFSQSALQTVGKQISSRQARFWVMWDEENIYVAMRDPLRPGERPVQAHRTREPGKDLDVIFDDCYEIWVSVDATDPLTGQPHCSSQFLGNFDGTRYDALHQPAVGNSRTSSYDCGWRPKNRITGKNEWEMELAIPRASLGTTKSPFHDGMRFRALIARNYKRPWEQNSFEGTSSFSVIDTHSEFIMSKTAPAMHLLSVGDAAAKKIGLRIAAFGQADAKIRWSYKSDTVSKDGTAEVKKGVLSEIADIPDLDVPGNGRVRVTVTDAAGDALLDWSALRAFGPIPKEEVKDTGDRLDLRLTFNPEKDYARIFGDFIGYDKRSEIKEVLIAVLDEKGKEIKRASTPMDNLAFAKAVMKFDNLAPGKYSVRIECKDSSGKAVASTDSSFTKDNLAAKFEWWKTKRGSIEKVIAPWTPVGLKGKTLAFWGREMEVGPAGLPARASTQGHEILAAPARLVATTADGKEITASAEGVKTLFDKDFRKTVEVSSRLGDIAVRSEVRAEFDGMYKVAMTLTPARPSALRKLQIVLPYKEDMAEYIHAVTAEIRSGFWYGFTPQGKGKVWDCILLGDKTMKVGSFIPYVWLGSTKGGLCWFADSDEGWIPSDAVPAVEIQRNAPGQVDLVLNLIGTEATVDSPRTITFGLQASPVKQMHEGWREDNWWCGDTFRNYAHDQNLIFASTPFVVPAYAAKAKELVEAQHKAGKPAVPYFIHEALPGHLAPEINYFGEQWKSTVDKALCYRGSLIDYMVYNWSRWAEQYGIDGYYVDNMRPIACDNIEHGCGYRLPDGRIQPSFQIFDTRDYFLRSRAAFLEQRPASRLVLHMTNAMIIPWVGPADVAYDGEHHVIYPEMKKDFMDFWSLERLRVDYPGQWGVAVNFMHEYQGNWDPVAMHLAMRAYFAEVMLHDALPTGNENGHASNLVKIRKAFGIGGGDVRFLAYWDKTGISCEGKDIKLAGWLKPDKLLLLVANFGEKQDAVVTLSPDKLGWSGASIAVADAERGYKQMGSRQIPKTDEELAAEQKAWETQEANRIAKENKAYEQQAADAQKAGKPAPAKPDIEAPRPFNKNPFRHEQVTCWNGDDAPPPKLEGSAITVAVERHSFRLLTVEWK